MRSQQLPSTRRCRQQQAGTAAAQARRRCQRRKQRQQDTADDRLHGRWLGVRSRTAPLLSQHESESSNGTARLGIVTGQSINPCRHTVTDPSSDAHCHSQGKGRDHVTAIEVALNHHKYDVCWSIWQVRCSCLGAWVEFLQPRDKQQQSTAFDKLSLLVFGLSPDMAGPGGCALSRSFGSQFLFDPMMLSLILSFTEDAPPLDLLTVQHSFVRSGGLYCCGVVVRVVRFCFVRLCVSFSVCVCNSRVSYLPSGSVHHGCRVVSSIHLDAP